MSERATALVGLPTEPATAILRDSSPSSEDATRAQVQVTDSAVDLPSGITNAPRSGVDKRIIILPFIIAIVALAGFAGYRYLRPTSSGHI